MKEDKCAYCDATEGLEWYHILPRSLGGTDESFNLIRVCNHHHALIHGLSSRGNISDLINKGLEKTKAKGTILGPPLKLSPDVLKSICEDRPNFTLQQLKEKYGYHTSLISRALLWKDKLDEYGELYLKQRSQLLT